MSARLLPANATPLERALAEAPVSDTLAMLADSVIGVKHTRPNAFLPWLASEWGLTPLAPYHPDLAALIAAGLPWLMERGTAAAVLRALAWLELTAILEPHGPRLQIDPGRVVGLDQVPAIRHLVGLSIPAQVHFARLYHGWDKRRLIASSLRSPIGQGMLSEDSGVVIDGLKISFGVWLRGAGEAQPAVCSGVIDALITGHLILSRWPRIGHYRLSRSWPWRASGSQGALMMGGNVPPDGVLSAHSRPRRFVRAALVAGEPLPLGTLNSRLSGLPPLTWPTIPWVMSQTVLSGQAQAWAKVERYEVWSETRAGLGELPLRLGMVTAQTAIQLGHAPRRPPAPQHRWGGGWDARRWQRPTAGSGHTFVEELSP